MDECGLPALYRSILERMSREELAEIQLTTMTELGEARRERDKKEEELEAIRNERQRGGQATASKTHPMRVLAIETYLDMHNKNSRRPQLTEFIEEFRKRRPANRDNEFANNWWEKLLGPDRVGEGSIEKWWKSINQHPL